MHQQSDAMSSWQSDLQLHQCVGEKFVVQKIPASSSLHKITVPSVHISATSVTRVWLVVIRLTGCSSPWSCYVSGGSAHQEIHNNDRMSIYIYIWFYMMYYRFCKSNPINIRCLWWPVCTHSTHQVYLRIPHDLGVSWCISVYRTTDHGVYLGVSLKSAANSKRTVLAWLPHPTQALQGLASPESSPQWTAGTAHIGCRIKPLRCNLGGEMKYLKYFFAIFCNEQHFYVCLF